MSTQQEQKNINHYSEGDTSVQVNRRVDVNDLVSKMNDEKKQDRKISFICHSHHCKIVLK